MSTQNPSAAREAAVFIDLENIGSPPFNVDDSGYYYRYLGSIVDKIVSVLEIEEGLLVKERWAVARGVVKGTSGHSGKHFSVSKNFAVQIRVTETLNAHGVDMGWSQVSADEALIKEVRRRFMEGLLPTWVVLVSGDQDFIPLAEQLEKAGHGIIAIMREGKGKGWRKVAHAVIFLNQKRQT